MSHPPLHVRDGMAAVALVPGAVQVFCDAAKLDDEMLAEVLGLHLPSLLAPKSQEFSFIIPHNDPSVRSPKESGCARSLTLQFDPNPFYSLPSGWLLNYHMVVFNPNG